MKYHKCKEVVLENDLSDIQSLETNHRKPHNILLSTLEKYQSKDRNWLKVKNSQAMKSMLFRSGYSPVGHVNKIYLPGC